MTDKIVHADMVAGLAKSGEEILGDFTPGSYSLLKEAILRALAVGDKIDTVKKQVVYNKDMGLGPMTIHPFPEMTATQCHNLHMAIGVFGEAAELLENVFLQIDNNTEVDRKNLVEELGDIEFYLEGIRQGTEITRDEALDGNIAKLGARYKGFNYSDQAAQLRADKAPETPTPAV